MNITSISQINNRNRNNTFKASGNFSQIKKIPKMFCASCGKPTLDIDLYIKTLIPICQPLSNVIKRRAFNQKYQQTYPLVFAKLIELAERYPKKSIDEIFNKEKGTYAELKKAVVQTLEVQKVENDTPERFILDRNINRVFFDTIEMGRSHLKRASSVIKQLLKLKIYLENFDDIRKDAFVQLEIYARKYPNKTLAEIIQIPQIAKFHKMKDIYQRAESKELSEYHFENIRNMVKTENPSAVEIFDQLKETVLKLYETEHDEKARKYIAKCLYKKALNEQGCKNLEESVLNELNQIPTSYTTKDSFFSVASGHHYNDIQIVNSFFKDLLTSEDHINPISHGGRDFIGNKLIMHALCNYNRASKSYAEYLNYHSEMGQYATEQINLISENLLKRKLPDKLRTYPFRLADTLLIASNEKLKLNVNEYCEKIFQQSQRKIKKFQKKLEELKNTFDASREEIASINASIEEEQALQDKIKNFLIRHKNLHSH